MNFMFRKMTHNFFIVFIIVSLLSQHLCGMEKPSSSAVPQLGTLCIQQVAQDFAPYVKRGKRKEIIETLQTHAITSHHCCNILKVLMDNIQDDEEVKKAFRDTAGDNFYDNFKKIILHQQRQNLFSGNFLARLSCLLDQKDLAKLINYARKKGEFNSKNIESYLSKTFGVEVEREEETAPWHLPYKYTEEWVYETIAKFDDKASVYYLCDFINRTKRNPSPYTQLTVAGSNIFGYRVTISGICIAASKSNKYLLKHILKQPATNPREHPTPLYFYMRALNTAKSKVEQAQENNLDKKQIKRHKKIVRLLEDARTDCEKSE